MPSSAFAVGSPPPNGASIPNRRSVGLLIGSLIAVVLGLGVSWLGSRDIINELGLRADHATVDAAVTNTRIMKSRKLGTRYEVQYQFTPPGSSEAYTRRDETGRDNLWSELADEATWSEAKETGKVRVFYRANAPWTNRPEMSGAMPLGDPIALIMLGLFFAVPGLFFLFRAFRRTPSSAS